MNNLFFCGIDIGSSATKLVLLDSKGEMVDYEALQKGVAGYSIDTILKTLCERNSIENVSQIIKASTGYGRVRYKEADMQKSEISCHAKGVISLIPETGTIIDIGGQDLKAMRISENGNIEEFVMNDKCAAGTGRFIDVMSQVLGVEIYNMGEVDSHAEKTIRISNTCTVFAESEVISYLSEDEKIENIVAGIHSSVAQKAASLAKRIGINERVVLTGGVAQNQGIVRAVSRELNREVMVPSIPQFTGALGAAKFAYEDYTKNRN